MRKERAKEEKWSREAGTQRPYEAESGKDKRKCCHISCFISDLPAPSQPAPPHWISFSLSVVASPLVLSFYCL